MSPAVRFARIVVPVAVVAAIGALPACGNRSFDDDEPVIREALTSTEVEVAEISAPPPQVPVTEPVVTEPPTTVPVTAPPAPPPTTAPRVVAKAAPLAQLPVRAPEVVGTIEPYRGLGTWVDVYDWSHYKNSTPTVGPDDVDRMAAAGVQTLYLQTSKHDTPDVIAEPELLLPIIERARTVGIRVIAWYLPTLEDPQNDLNRLLASARLDVDGIAVDIESRNVADVQERNRRLIELSAALREALPGRAIGAIVLPPVVLEVVNPNYWPNFPYREIASNYDVWMTMGYWTNRKAESGYRDPYRYTDENVRRLRNNLGQAEAPVHPVGGIGGAAGGDIDAYRRACVDNAVIGGSLYDWRTTRDDAWEQLRAFRTA